MAAAANGRLPKRPFFQREADASCSGSESWTSTSGFVRGPVLRHSLRDARRIHQDRGGPRFSELVGATTFSTAGITVLGKR
jgi:hypothetical protein